MTVTGRVHGSFWEHLCSGEAPKDRQPNCIQMPWLIRAHTIRFCFISYSIKSKGRGRSNRLQSPVRITILHSNSFSSFTNHRGHPQVVWSVIFKPLRIKTKQVSEYLWWKVLPGVLSEFQSYMRIYLVYTFYSQDTLLREWFVIYHKKSTQTVYKSNIGFYFFSQKE